MVMPWHYIRIEPLYFGVPCILEIARYYFANSRIVQLLTRKTTVKQKRNVY
jgi:hypothetical protein